MRATTLLRTLLAVTAMIVMKVRREATGALIATVRPRWWNPRCGDCGKHGPTYDTSKKPRLWRALSFGATKVFLEYAPRRVSCAHCGGVRVEEVPWAPHDSAFTHQFEELVAYLARVTDKTSVSNLMGVSWRAVSGIVERIVGRRLDATRLDDLKRIGVDEFSYRKRHRYITTVVDHATGKVIWAGKGKGKKTLGEFFEALGKERAAKLETITMDMSGSFQAAVKEHAPQAQIVFDRFHVQKLASDALDKVRRELWRELQYEEDGHTIKKSRFALLKNLWNLTPRQRRKLSEIQKTNKPLYRAYLLKEALAKALDYLQPKRACDALDAWLTWAFRCRLKPFIKLARTIRKHKEGILAYIKDRLTNGIVEGINNRLRVVARRAYGYHSAEALIGMLFLNCGGIQLDPPLP